MPVGAFLVEHPDGTAVFDTGMHADLEHTKERLRSTARALRGGALAGVHRSPDSSPSGASPPTTSTWRS